MFRRKHLSFPVSAVAKDLRVTKKMVMDIVLAPPLVVVFYVKGVPYVPDWALVRLKANIERIKTATVTKIRKSGPRGARRHSGGAA